MRFTDESAIGEILTPAGKHICFTLEDKVQPEGAKIPGRTAIPYGTYRITMDWSPKHRSFQFHILNVPNFEGVRIDIANKASEVEGCIAVGLSRSPNWVGQSEQAFIILGSLILETLFKGEEVWIEIKKGEEMR